MAAPTASVVASQSQPLPQAQPAQQQPLTDVEDGIVRQVEWYLGPINLQKDFYLQSKMDPGYWVDLSVILAFPKMKALGVSDAAVVASLLSRESSRIEVDTVRNCIRPSWAKRSILALTAVPAGTSVAAVEGLFADLPATLRPVVVAPILEKEGLWHVVFENSDDARLALEKVQHWTIGESKPPAKVKALPFPTYDISVMLLGGIAGMPGDAMAGQALGGAFYDGTGSAGVMANVPGGYSSPAAHGLVTPQMNGISPQTGGNPAGTGAYGYQPVGGFQGVGSGGPNSFSIGGVSGYPRGGYPAAGGSPYYMNGYGPQTMYDPVVSGSPTPSQHNGGTNVPSGRPPTPQMEAAAAAALAQAQAGALAGNVNVGGHGSKSLSITGTPLGTDPSAVPRARPTSRRQHGQASGMGAQPQQNRCLGMNGGYEQAGGTRGGQLPNSGRHSASSGGVSLGELLGGAGKGHIFHPLQGTTGGPRKAGSGPNSVGNGGGAGGVDATGPHKGAKSHGHSGDASPRPANSKNKKKRATNRQSTGGNGALGYSTINAGDVVEGSGDGKRFGGDEPRHVGEDRKPVKPEPNLTAMYFPPLPGADDSAAAKSKEARSSLGPGYVVNGETSGSGKDASKHPTSPTAAARSSDAESVAASEEPNGGPVGKIVASAPGRHSGKAAASGSPEEVGQREESGKGETQSEKVVSVSDVSSTSSASGSHIGSGASPGGVSSVASQGSIDEAPITVANGGMSYASIVRAKAKKPAVPPPSDKLPVSSASVKAVGADATGGSTAGDGKEHAVDGTGSMSGNGATGAKLDGDGNTSPGDGDGGKGPKTATVSPVAIAPRSVWANKPKSVLQATPAIKPVKVPASASANLARFPEDAAAIVVNATGQAVPNGTSSSTPTAKAATALGNANGSGGRTAAPGAKHANENGKLMTGYDSSDASSAVTSTSSAATPKGVWGQSPKLWSKELAAPEKVGVKTEP
jgi:La domain